MRSSLHQRKDKRFENVSAGFRSVEILRNKMVSTLENLERIHRSASGFEIQRRRSPAVPESEVLRAEEGARAAMADLESRLRELDPLVELEPVGRRKGWRERVKLSRERVESLRRALNTQLKRADSRRTRTNLFSGGSTLKTDRSTMDTYRKEHDSLQNIHRDLDDQIEMGHGTLKKIREQGNVLKRTRRRLTDLTARLGLSDSLAGLIAQRNAADRWLVYGGMVVTVLVTLALWWFWT
eukprot:694722_1